MIEIGLLAWVLGELMTGAAGLLLACGPTLDAGLALLAGGMLHALGLWCFYKDAVRYSPKKKPNVVRMGQSVNLTNS